VSYILDALKKAAEQRGGTTPEVRRLLSAPAVGGSRSRYVMLTAGAVGAIALATGFWIWLPADDVPAPTAKPVVAVVAAPAPKETAIVPVQEEKPRTPLGSSAAGNAPRTTSLAPRAAAPKPPSAAPKPSRVTPPLGVVSPAPPLIASLPPTPAPAGPRTDIAKLKVEVIVYSDDRPQRWAFISGRKYVEGDAIGAGARVEEIQSTGVVLVEDGRRITLRP
jgi:hypothetical protein